MYLTLSDEAIAEARDEKWPSNKLRLDYFNVITYSNAYLEN